MIDLSPELLDKVLNQGAGFAMALIMFIVWYRQNKGHSRRLEDLLRERKTDRDAMLLMLGRIAGHLDRSDAFVQFSREALHQLESEAPKRRALDTLLAEAVQRASIEAKP